MKKQLLTILIVILSVSGCAKDESTEKVPREQTILKEVEIFDLSSDQAQINFERSGTVKAAQEAYVSPQIPGKIVKIKVQMGQKVRKNDPLIILGDSLSTDLIDLQHKSSKEAENLAEQNKSLTDFAARQGVEATEIVSEMAFDAYLNGIETKKNTGKSFQKQLENLEIEAENAEKVFKNAQNNYYEGRDLLEDTEEDYDDFIDELDDATDDLEDIFTNFDNEEFVDEIEDQLNKQLKPKELEVLNARLAMEIARSRVDQADIAIEGAKTNFFGQSEQLSFAIDTTFNQYLAALNQIESMQAQGQLQEVGAENQLLQAETQLESATLNLEQKVIKAPIGGNIAGIEAQEGNLTAPGQILIKIEDTTELKVKLAISREEAELLKIGDTVSIESDFENMTGQIAAISPGANDITRKIDLEITIIKGQNTPPADSIVKVIFNPKIENTIFIPLNSLLIEDDRKYVRVLTPDNKVEKKEVETGQTIDDYIEINSGLNGTEQIIKNSIAHLEEGEKVKVKSNKISR